MSYYPDFAKRLNELLVKADRNAAWLARQVGVQPATVSRWLSGENRPRNLESVYKIAKAFELDEENTAELIADVGYETKPIDSTSTGGTEAKPSGDIISERPSILEVMKDSLQNTWLIVAISTLVLLGVAGVFYGLPGLRGIDSSSQNADEASAADEKKDSEEPQEAVSDLQAEQGTSPKRLIGYYEA